MEKEATFSPKATHIGVVVRNLDEATKYYSSVLGIGPFRFTELDLPHVIFKGKPDSLKIKMAWANIGTADIELIEAPPGDNVYQEFLRTKGEGVQHLGWHFDKDGYEAQLNKCEKQGIAVIQSAESEKVQLVYMDTAETVGALFEFVYRKTGLPGQ